MAALQPLHWSSCRMMVMAPKNACPAHHAGYHHGAIACASGALAQVTMLRLDSNQIGDQGLASLLAPPTADVLPSLKRIVLINNP